VLLAHLQPLLDRNKHPQQSGFTAGRSTVDAILALWLLSELHYAFSRPLHAAYIDVKAAFDAVDQAALWKALKVCWYSSTLDASSSWPTQWHNCKGPYAKWILLAIPHLFRLPQGCILAPALFCCATDWLIRQCRGKLGIQVGSSTFTDIDYADDAVLFTTDPAEWQEVLLSYETAANTMGLHCNWQKTKVQNVGAGPAPPPVQMENQLVESVTKFTDLGSDVMSSSLSTPEVHRHIGLANSIVGQLDGVWRNRRRSLNTKDSTRPLFNPSCCMDLRRGLLPKPTWPDCRLFTWRHNGAS